MPIDPYAALNAMLRAEAARFSPPPKPVEPSGEPAPAAEPPQPQAQAPADSAA